MPGKNRHREPTNRQLLWRLYREQLEQRHRIERLTAATRMLADHCRRLVREKEILMRERVVISGSVTDSIDVPQLIS